jgi:peptide/nickel transport system substrate-binding protein
MGIDNQVRWVYHFASYYVEKEVKMKSRVFWLILSCLMVLSMVLASCGTKTTPTTIPTTTTKATTTPTSTPKTSSTTTTTATTGKWWDKFGVPQYGGTLTFRRTTDPGHFDVWYRSTMGGSVTGFYLQELVTRDWTTNPANWEFKLNISPDQYKKGQLAENWEMPDAQTIIFHIRKGIMWQNKPPLNGREFVATDVVYDFERLIGIGVFTGKGSPYVTADEVTAALQSITAPDKYTVIIKWKYPSLDMLDNLSDAGLQLRAIVPKEVVDMGVADDWHYAVGTGPWIMDDYVSGSSTSFHRNPNYWKYDDRYPQNKLPYADSLKALIIPDIATAIAALRTGKIDEMEDVTPDKAASLAQTNPELLQNSRPLAGPALEFRCDVKPFTDIKVRTALQMSIDLNTIAKTFYSGVVEGTPIGLINDLYKDDVTPYEKWPQSLKDEYAYNPEGAKKLLADAGYPSGFKTNIVVPANQDMDLMQIVKSYFATVGVDMEIRVMDATAFAAFLTAWKHDQISARIPGGTAMPYSGYRALTRRWSKNQSNYTHNNDAKYDDYVTRYSTSVDIAERQKIINEAGLYLLSQHWAIQLLPTVNFCIYQSWLKGFNGEIVLDCATYWIDKSLK